MSIKFICFLLHKKSFLASSELRFSEKLCFEGTKSLSFDNFWLSFLKAWVLMPLSFEPNCETKSLSYTPMQITMAFWQRLPWNWRELDWNPTCLFSLHALVSDTPVTDNPTRYAWKHWMRLNFAQNQYHRGYSRRHYAFLFLKMPLAFTQLRGCSKIRIVK